MSEELNPTEESWDYREDGDANFYHITDRGGKWLLCLQHNGEQPTDQQRANMRMIAAAPKMLAALKYLESFLPCIVEDPENSTAVRIVSVAIKKAKGEAA